MFGLKRKILIICCCLVFTPILLAQNVRVGLLNGPTCIPAAKMLTQEGSEYTFEIFADPAALIPKMIKKEIDVGFLPVNAAAKVFNSSNKMIIVCAVTGNGNLTLITKDKTVKKFSDLKGKTVHMAGQGATPEYMFTYLAGENNISINDKKGITLDYSIPAPQLASMLITDKISYAVVPEPFSTIAKNKDRTIVTAIDLQEEFEASEGLGKTYPLSVMVVRKEFADSNPELLKKFLNAYEQSFEWTLNHPMAAGRLCEKYNLGLTAQIVAKSIPNANYVFIPAEDAKRSIDNLLNIFMEFVPASIGGKLPDEIFYLKQD